MTVPLGGLTAREQADTARELVDAGYTDLWSSEVAGTDCFTPLATAAQADDSVRLGTAIAQIFARSPALLAQSAAALAALAPGRVVIGLGTSSKIIVEQWNSAKFERPYARTRDTLRFLRRAFHGERVSADFDTFSVDGFRLEIPPAQHLPLYLAALRPGMLGLAAREADGAIVNWLSAADMDRVSALVRTQRADKEIVVRLIVVPTADEERARAIGRRLITAYLTVPTYADYQRWLGREDVLASMWSHWERGDRRAALAAVPDKVVDELVIHGSMDKCREHIAEYRRDPYVTPVISIQDTGADPRVVARALAPR